MPWLLGLWAMLVVLNYAGAPGHRIAFAELAGFVVPRHGAFSTSVLVEGWAARGQAVLAWLALNAAIGGAGAGAARWLGVRPGRVRGWLLGLAPLSLLLLAAGLTGLLARPVLGGILLACAGPWWRLRVRRAVPPRETLLAALPCVIALPAALAPEIVFDALRYHLALPELYLRAHKMVAVDRFLFASFPQGMELLFTPALAFGTTVTAKLLVWQTFAATAVLLYGFLRSRLPFAHAQLLGLGYTAMPFLSVHAATAGVDHPVICLSLAAFLPLADAAEGRVSARRAAVAGWLLGTALGIKYLAAFAIGAATVSLLLTAPGALWTVARTVAPFLAAVPGAWFVKNWLLTGNPSSPYVFGHWQLEPETFRLHLQWARDWQAEHPWWTAWAALIPVALTRGIYDALGEALSPAVFLVLGLAAVAPRPFDRSTRFLLALCAILWLVWVRSAGGIFRYLAPFYPVVILAVGALLGRRREIPAAAVTGVLTLAALAQLSPLLAAHARGAAAAGVLLGWETEREYLGRILPPPGRYLPAMARAAAGAGPGRALMLGDPKTLYAPGRWITEFEFAPTLLFRLAEDSADADRMRVALRQRRVTVVLYRVEGMISMARMSGALLHGAALARYQEFWARWMHPAWVDEHPAENSFYQCYHVRRSPARFDPPRSALRFALPGLETLTGDADRALDARNGADALRLTRALVSREPRYAAGWYRLALAARAAGNREEAGRAAGQAQRFGYERLLDRQP